MIFEYPFRSDVFWIDYKPDDLIKIERLRIFFAYFLLCFSLVVGFVPFYVFLTDFNSYINSGYIFSFGLVSVVIIILSLDYLVSKS